MSHKSPSKVLRNVKRITIFLVRMAEQKLQTVEKLPNIDVPPTVKILSFSRPTIVSILPSPRYLLQSKPVFLDIPSETQRHYNLTVSRLDQPYEPPMKYLSKLQTNIPAQSTTALGTRIPQLDSGGDQCSNCKRVLETTDDMKWHYETQRGCEDCSILRSMLGWNPPYYKCIVNALHLIRLNDCLEFDNKDTKVS